MLASSPLADGVQYRILAPYGLAVFDCPALRATLQPHHCAANWVAHRDGSQCLGCATGAIHAGKPPSESQKPPLNSRAQACCRCGVKPSYRMIGGVFCPSCYNRSSEITRGTNSKGKLPWHTAEKLREGFAIVKTADAGAVLREVFKTQASRTEPRPPRRLKIEHKPGLPFFSILDAKHLWTSAIVTGSDELQRIVSRLIPDSQIIEADFSAVFADRWRAEKSARQAR